MRQTGTVKFYNQSKGYGFITPDEGGKDVFVHVTALERSGVGFLGCRSTPSPTSVARAPRPSICSWPEYRPSALEAPALGWLEFTVY